MDRHRCTSSGYRARPPARLWKTTPTSIGMNTKDPGHTPLLLELVKELDALDR
uniref:Uncharacterized protein n=1 Tax=Candidatus Kentrum sp. FW TaxID=2126338 RepID=A0A450TT47_9GAMM|nr:MAG: hypothetical protein BECKFW1821C_GA0114237_10283 [Candidatus Kentron sp. FW]